MERLNKVAARQTARPEVGETLRGDDLVCSGGRSGLPRNRERQSPVGAQRAEDAEGLRLSIGGETFEEEAPSINAHRRRCAESIGCTRQFLQRPGL